MLILLTYDLVCKLREAPQRPQETKKKYSRKEKAVEGAVTNACEWSPDFDVGKLSFSTIFRNGVGGAGNVLHL